MTGREGLVAEVESLAEDCVADMCGLHVDGCQRYRDVEIQVEAEDGAGD